jgi:hypothetical protein
MQKNEMDRLAEKMEQLSIYASEVATIFRMAAKERYTVNFEKWGFEKDKSFYFYFLPPQTLDITDEYAEYSFHFKNKNFQQTHTVSVSNIRNILQFSAQIQQDFYHQLFCYTPNFNTFNQKLLIRFQFDNREKKFSAKLNCFSENGQQISQKKFLFDELTITKIGEAAQQWEDSILNNLRL